MIKLGDIFNKETILRELNKNTSKEISNEEILKVKNVIKDLVETIYKLSLIYVPYDTGVLRENMLKTHSKNTREEDIYEIENDTPYAFIVHDNFFNSHDYPTRAFYLTDAYYEAYNYFENEGVIPKWVDITKQLNRTSTGGIILTIKIQYGRIY